MPLGAHLKAQPGVFPPSPRPGDKTISTRREGSGTPFPIPVFLWPVAIFFARFNAMFRETWFHWHTCVQIMRIMLEFGLVHKEQQPYSTQHHSVQPAALNSFWRISTTTIHEPTAQASMYMEFMVHCNRTHLSMFWASNKIREPHAKNTTILERWTRGF